MKVDKKKEGKKKKCIIIIIFFSLFSFFFLFAQKKEKCVTINRVYACLCVCVYVFTYIHNPWYYWYTWWWWWTGQFYWQDVLNWPILIVYLYSMVRLVELYGFLYIRSDIHLSLSFSYAILPIISIYIFWVGLLKAWSGNQADAHSLTEY